MTAPPRTLSFSAVWDDTARMLQANAGLLTAIAGVFIFLPAVLVARYLPPAESAATLQESLVNFQAYMQRAWPWLLLANLANMTGVIAIYLLLLAMPRLTVGGAVVRAVAILPFFWLLTIILNLAWGIGFLLLILPFVYLLGRLVLSSPALVAEMPRAPISALSRAWRLSEGRGWAIALMVILVYLAAGIVGFAIQAGAGTIVLLTLGNEGVGGLVVAILVAAVNAAAAVVAVVLIAAIYRHVTGSMVVLAKTD